MTPADPGPTAPTSHPAPAAPAALVPMAQARRRSPLLWWAAAGLLGAGLGLGTAFGRLTAPPPMRVIVHHVLPGGPLPGCALAPEFDPDHARRPDQARRGPGLGAPATEHDPIAGSPSW